MDFEHVLDQLFNNLNHCRTRPRTASQELTQLRNQYQGTVLKGKIKTREGVQALDQLVRELQMRPEGLGKLKWSYALHLVADEQANILGENSLVSTENTRFQKSLPERVKDVAIVKGRLCEVNEFGGKTAEEILEELLIDDGLVSRKRRNTLLDPVFNYIGIGCNYHQKYDACTVIILAQDIISLVAPDQTGRFRKRKPLEKHEQVYKIKEQVQPQFILQPQHSAEMMKNDKNEQKNKKYEFDSSNQAASYHIPVNNQQHPQKPYSSQHFERKNQQSEESKCSIM